MNNKEDCVFVGPVFGGQWIPITAVEPIEVVDDPRYSKWFGIKRMSFYHKGKKMESQIVKK